MSDGSPGQGWWQASDGQWYPPDQHPDFQAGATPPADPGPPTAAMPATAALPSTPPPGPPMAPPPMGAPMGPPPGPPPAGAPASSNAKWIIVGVLAVAVLAIGAFLLLGGDDKKKVVAGSDSTSSSSSSSTSSSSASKSSSSSSKSSSSSSGPTEAELQSLLLTASDISPSFTDGPFTPDNTTPAPCGQPNAATQFPPVIDVGSTAANGDGTLVFQEELSTYEDASTAAKALQAGLQGLSCTQGTVSNGSAVTISQPKDASATVGFSGALEIDIQSPGFTGQLFVAQHDNAIVVFQFQRSTGAPTDGVPSAESLAKKGFQKLAG